MTTWCCIVKRWNTSESILVCSYDEYMCVCACSVCIYVSTYMCVCICTSFYMHERSEIDVWCLPPFFSPLFPWSSLLVEFRATASLARNMCWRFPVCVSCRFWDCTWATTHALHLHGCWGSLLTESSLQIKSTPLNFYLTGEFKILQE